jgi:hypothetical protein
MTPFEIGYLMGLLVGEGSFTSSDARPILKVSMTAPDLVTLQYIQQRLGGNINGPYRSNNAAHTPYYTWKTTSTEVLAVICPLILDHMPESHKRTQFLGWYAIYKPWIERTKYRRKHDNAV